MKDFFVVNKYTGQALGVVRAKTIQVAGKLAKAMFGCHATVN